MLRNVNEDIFKEDLGKRYDEILSEITAGNVEGIRALLKNEPSLMSHFFDSCIGMAIRSNQEMIVTDLIDFAEQGKKNDAQLAEHYIWKAMIDIAVNAKLPNMVRLMLEKDIPLPSDSRMLDYPISSLDILLQAEPTLIFFETEDGDSLLSYAVTQRIDEDKVTFLLEKGADPFFEQRILHKSTMDLALSWGIEKAIHALLKAGVPLDLEKKYTNRVVKKLVHYDPRLVLHLFSKKDIEQYLKLIPEQDKKSFNYPWRIFKQTHIESAVDNDLAGSIIKAIYATLEAMLHAHHQITNPVFLLRTSCSNRAAPWKEKAALEALLRSIYGLQSMDKLAPHMEILQQPHLRKICGVLCEVYTQAIKADVEPMQVMRAG